MPLFNSTNKKSSIAPVPTPVRKSRLSNRVTISAKGSENASSEKASVPQAQDHNSSDSDSESDDKHSEVLPASDVTILNDYSIGPAFGQKFPIPFIRYMIDRVLMARLKGKTYQPGDAVKWVREIADETNLKMTGFCRKHRYKHVINVIIYQQTGAGFFNGFRAVWDRLADDYTYCTFDGGTFICVVSVFGCYQY